MIPWHCDIVTREDRLYGDELLVLFKSRWADHQNVGLARCPFDRVAEHGVDKSVYDLLLPSTA